MFKNSSSDQSTRRVIPLDNFRESERLDIIGRITVLHPDFQALISAIDECIKNYKTAGETICIYVLGEPGCGKTHTSNRFLRLYPDYRREGQLIKPIVRVRVPSDPTVKGLSIAILEAFNDPNAASGSEQEMAERIDYFIQRCATMLVILEEVHHFVDADSDKRNTKVANWLKIRIEETGVPFLIEGLPSTQILFNHDDQLRDRFDGPFMLKPFIWFKHGKEPTLADRPFRSFLHHLSSEVPFEDCIDFGGGNNALRFFCISGGVPRRVGKLLKRAAILAEDAKSETIDLGVLEKAYNIRTGHRFTGSRNPFSLDFDLIKAEEKLKREATRPPKKKGEGIVES